MNNVFSSRKDKLSFVFKYAFRTLISLRGIIATIIFAFIGFLVSYILKGNIILGISCGLLFSILFFLVLLLCTAESIDKDEDFDIDHE